MYIHIKQYTICIYIYMYNIQISDTIGKKPYDQDFVGKGVFSTVCKAKDKAGAGRWQ